MINTILTASIFLFNTADAVDKYDCSQVQFPDIAAGDVILNDGKNPHRISFPISPFSAVQFTLNQGIKSKNGAYCLAVTKEEVLIASSDGNIVFRFSSTNASFGRPSFMVTVYQILRYNMCDMVLTYFDENQYINSEHYQHTFWDTNKTGIGSIELNDFGQFIFSVNDKVIKIVGLGHDTETSGEYCSHHVQFPVKTVGHGVTLPDDKNPHRIWFGILYSEVEFTLNQGIKSQDGEYCLAVTKDGVVIASRHGEIVFRLFTSNVSLEHPELLLTYYQEISHDSRMRLQYEEEWQNSSFPYKHGQRISMKKTWITNDTGIGLIELTNMGQLVFSVNGKVIKTVGLIDPDVSNKTPTKRLNKIQNRGSLLPNDATAADAVDKYNCSRHVQFPVRTVGYGVTLPDDKNPHRIWFGTLYSGVELTLNQGIKSQDGAYCLVVTNDGVVIASIHGEIVFRLFISNVSLEHPELLLTYYQEISHDSRMWIQYEEEWQNSSFPYKHGQRINMQKTWITNETGIGSIELTNMGQLVFSVNGKVIKTVGLIDPDVSGKTKTKRLNDINKEAISSPTGRCKVIVVHGILKLTTYKYNVNQNDDLQDLYTAFQRDLRKFQEMNPQIRIANNCTLQMVYDDNVRFVNMFVNKDWISQNEFLTYEQKMYSSDMSCVLQMQDNGSVILHGSSNEKTIGSAKAINHKPLFGISGRFIGVIEAKKPGNQKTFSGNMSDYTVLQTFEKADDGSYVDRLTLTDTCEVEIIILLLQADEDIYIPPI